MLQSGLLSHIRALILRHRTSMHDLICCACFFLWLGCHVNNLSERESAECRICILVIGLKSGFFAVLSAVEGLRVAFPTMPQGLTPTTLIPQSCNILQDFTTAVDEPCHLELQDVTHKICFVVNALASSPFMYPIAVLCLIGGSYLRQMPSIERLVSDKV